MSLPRPPLPLLAGAALALLLASFRARGVLPITLGEATIPLWGALLQAASARAASGELAPAVALRRLQREHRRLLALGGRSGRKAA